MYVYVSLSAYSLPVPIHFLGNALCVCCGLGLVVCSSSTNHGVHAWIYPTLVAK